MIGFTRPFVHTSSNPYRFQNEHTYSNWWVFFLLHYGDMCPLSLPLITPICVCVCHCVYERVWAKVCRFKSTIRQRWEWCFAQSDTLYCLKRHAEGCEAITIIASIIAYMCGGNSSKFRIKELCLRNMSFNVVKRMAWSSKHAQVNIWGLGMEESDKVL